MTRNLFLLLTGGLALGVYGRAVAEPLRLDPAPGETLYFHRHYANAHLTAHPKQVVESLTIELRPPTEGGAWSFALHVQKVDEERPVFSGSGVWEKVKAGVLRFHLEGDAGTGTLEAHEGYVLLKLRGEDFLVLQNDDPRFGESSRGDRTLEFEADDAEHRTFKLQSATEEVHP